MPTIQGELEGAVCKVTGERVRVKGAGRTDTGVHARGQVAAFECSFKWSSEALLRALNFYLPGDISVKDVCETEARFDPRRSAVSREYRYTILNSPARSPILSRWTVLVKGQLDTEAMARASEALIGEHDFAPFTNREGSTKGTVRRVLKSGVRRRGKLIFVDIEANAFLPQQVRRVVGSLVRVGSGQMGVEEFCEVAASGEVGKARFVAPARGLCLMKVNYSEIGFSYENI